MEGEVSKAATSNGRLWHVEQSDALAWLRARADSSASLVLTSPPFGDARTYGIDFNLTGQEWVDWLRPIVREACRVSEGLVIVNAAGKVEDWSYQPIIEWLVSDLTRHDGIVCGPSPWAWVKSGYDDDAAPNGLFGSGGERYQRRDWEPLYAFVDPAKLPLVWTDNTAFGKPPKPSSFGGKSTMRGKDGARANARWNCGRCEHAPDGTIVTRRYHNGTTGGKGQPIKKRERSPIPDLVNPGNVIRAPVGGSKLGHALAHGSEAPMSLHVAERCICWYANPEKPVVDPFAGSGTTGHAAIEHGRKFIGCDIRPEQVELARRRLSGVTSPLF